MRNNKLFMFMAVLIMFALVFSGCGSSDPAPAPDPVPPANGGDTPPVVDGDDAPGEFDPYRDIIIPMVQEYVDLGLITVEQGDYLVFKSRNGDYPRGAKPGLAEALESPPPIPDGWEGPREVAEPSK